MLRGRLSPGLDDNPFIDDSSEASDNENAIYSFPVKLSAHELVRKYLMEKDEALEQLQLAHATISNYEVLLRDSVLLQHTHDRLSTFEAFKQILQIPYCGLLYGLRFIAKFPKALTTLWPTFHQEVYRLSKRDNNLEEQISAIQVSMKALQDQVERMENQILIRADHTEERLTFDAMRYNMMQTT